MIKRFILLAFAATAVCAGTISIPSGKSISKAMITARRGDTLLLAPGIYKENIVMKDGITIKGESPTNTKIKGNGRASTVILNGSSTISGVTITGGQNGIEAKSGRARIDECVVTGNRGSGILIVKAFPEITNSVFSNNGASGIKATSIGGGALLLENLTFAGNSKFGIDIETTVPLSISNSIFYKNSLKAVRDKNERLVLDNNIMFPVQSEYSQNNREIKPLFSKEKKLRSAYIQEQNSPGNSFGAKLPR